MDEDKKEKKTLQDVLNQKEEYVYLPIKRTSSAVFQNVLDKGTTLLLMFLEKEGVENDEINKIGYTVAKILMNFTYLVHKETNWCDANHQNRPCNFKTNLESFKEAFSKEISNDPDFAKGGALEEIINYQTK